MTWLGLKKLAYVPLTRSNVPSDVPPPDWANQIMQRVYDDIDLKKTLVDRSLRAYIHTVSSGLADIQVDVRPQETIAGTGAGGTDVPPDALEARLGNQLRALGYDGAAIVMLGGPGGGSTTGYWSRFSMLDDHGVWVGEIVHQTNLCNLPDLLDFTDEFPDENMGVYDQEAGYGYTHFSVWTKRAIGWLNPSTVPLHVGHSANYTLHWASLIQPPPAGRVAAVQVGTQVPYLMIELAPKPTNLISTFRTTGSSSTRSKQAILSGTRRTACLPSTCSRKPGSRRDNRSRQRARWWSKLAVRSLAASPSPSPITPWGPCLASWGRRSRRRRNTSRRPASCRNSSQQKRLQPLAAQSAWSRK